MHAVGVPSIPEAMHHRTQHAGSAFNFSIEFSIDAARWSKSTAHHSRRRKRTAPSPKSRTLDWPGAPREQFGSGLLRSGQLAEEGLGLCPLSGVDRVG